VDDGPYALVVEDSPDPVDLALLEERVAAAAIAAAGVGEDRAFGIFVRDEERRIVAGISGMTWGGFCELHAMWVDEPLRGRGLGRALMARAESVARQRGCALVEFFAYDLLAGGLYERLGYESVGVIEGCPAGSAARWYRKNISRTDPEARGSPAAASSPNGAARGRQAGMSSADD
jgi:GNAT superfamily N-acetyltransferase